MTLIEVHQELAKTMRVAKDIAHVFKRTRKEAEQITKEWTKTTQTNKLLQEQLQQAELKLLEAKVKLQ